MRSILVVTKDKDDYRIIRKCHRSAYRVDLAPTSDTALNMLRHRRYDYLFMDIDLLRASQTGGFKTALQALWQVFPTIEIVVMCPQDGNQGSCDGCQSRSEQLPDLSPESRRSQIRDRKH